MPQILTLTLMRFAGFSVSEKWSADKSFTRLVADYVLFVRSEAVELPGLSAYGPGSAVLPGCELRQRLAASTDTRRDAR